MICRWKTWFSVLAIHLTVAPSLYAYDRTGALKYAATWWNSTTIEGQLGQGFSPRGTVDHISPGYSWYYKRSAILFNTTFHDDGNDSLDINGFNVFEEDCTNWASQVLKAGNVTLTGAGLDGNGGTTTSVTKLRAAMTAAGIVIDRGADVAERDQGRGSGPRLSRSRNFRLAGARRVRAPG